MSTCHHSLSAGWSVSASNTATVMRRVSVMSGWPFWPGRALTTTETDFGSANWGYDLVEKRGLMRYQARTYLCVGALVIPWTKHPASGCELVRRAFDAAYRVGDLAFAGYGLRPARSR